MKVSDLQVGKTVIFEAVPNGSYLSRGVIYRVERIEGREVHFRRLTGSGTSERKYMLAMPNVSFYEASC